MGKKSKKHIKEIEKKNQNEGQLDLCPIYQEHYSIARWRQFYSQSNYWFIEDHPLEAIAVQLSKERFVYFENFLPDDHSRLLLKDIRNLEQSGVFKSGYLAGNNVGGGLRYVHDQVRGDHIYWSNASTTEDTNVWSKAGDPSLKWEQNQNSLSLYLKRMDTLLAQLGETNVLKDELSEVHDRSHAMLAHYPPGSQYVRHCDNHCNDGSGNDCNGRRITAIIYLNENWKEEDGGELLIYDGPPKHDDKMWRIPPKLGSVILFFSDYRVPHAVLPTNVHRYGVTTWYYDQPERTQALERAKVKPEEDVEKQRQRVEQEMKSFEERTGTAVNETVEGSYQAQKASELLSPSSTTSTPSSSSPSSVPSSPNSEHDGEMLQDSKDSGDSSIVGDAGDFSDIQSKKKKKKQKKKSTPPACHAESTESSVCPPTSLLALLVSKNQITEFVFPETELPVGAQVVSDVMI